MLQLQRLIRRDPKAAASSRRFWLAAGRVAASALALVPFVVALRQIERDQAQWLFWAGTAAAFAITFVFTLRKIGYGTDIVVGFWLWLYSTGLITGTLACIYGILTAASGLLAGGLPPLGWGIAAGCFVVGILLAAICDNALEYIEEG